MLNKLITKLTIWALKSHRLTGEQRGQLKLVLIENIGALPIKKIIVRDEMGRLIVNGKHLDVEQILAFRQSLMSLKDNPARKLISDQKKFLAVEMGVHKGLNPEMIEFSKACLWNIEQDEKIIDEILAE